MSVVLQISDPHFGTDQPPVVEALVALALRERPDLVVLSGDVTQRARANQFRAAKSFIDRLGAPVLSIPGNHDIPLFNPFARLFCPYAGYCAAFGAELEPVHSSRDLLVQCVNTTRWYRHVNGEVSPEQVVRVAARLMQADPGQLRIVVVHQPVAVLHDEDMHDRVRGFGDAVRGWAAAGCDLVMGGHIHLPFVMEMPDLDRRLWAVQAGTAVSARVRDGFPNSVNLLRWDGDSVQRTCLVERWDFAARPQIFTCEHVTRLHPDSRGR